MPMHATRRAPLRLFRLLLACGVLLAGCKLVDQRTFDRTAGRAPVPRAPPATPAPPPARQTLFVVHSGEEPQDWQPGLRRAVEEALARKPNVLFTVQSVAPVSASPEAQAASLQAATMDAGRPVADAIAADGARPAQIELAAAVDPAVRAPEVRVTVR